MSIVGCFIIPHLSIKLNPSSSLPSITVNYSWQNASSYTLERDITSKLEAGFATLKGLKNLNSRSARGNGYIILEFDQYTDIDVARFETATIIRQLYKQLPEQATYPTLNVNRADEEESRAFLSYSINAPLNPISIQETVTTQIQPIIGAIQNIDKTEIYGANPKEYIITFNSNTLASLNLNKQSILTALQHYFKREALGTAMVHNQNISLSIQPYKNIDDWHIPITKVGNRLLYLDELTTIKAQEQESQSYYRINGVNAITLNIYATKKANTIALSQTVKETLLDIESQLPKNYTIIETYDSTDYLKQELDKIYERSFYTVVILLLFILFISKSFKYLLLSLIHI